MNLARPDNDLPRAIRLVVYSLVTALVLPAVLASVSSLAAPAVADEPKLAAAKPDTEDFPGSVRLILPPRLPAIVGVETNIYFDNVTLVLNPANFAFDVTCGKGRQQVERWTFTPQATDVGDHPLSIVVRDQANEVVARASTVVQVVATDARADQPLSVLMIGDSLTHASVYPQHVWELCRPAGNPKLTLVGSHGPGEMLGEVRHEGYGGWTALRFATHFTGKAREGDYKQRGSPFLYAAPDGKPALDFSQYCRDVNGGKTPDVVTVFLGPNDIFSLNDDTLEEGLDVMLKHYESLAAMVSAANPTTRFAALLPVPPAATQDAFGANYASGQTRWQYKRNQHRLVERMMLQFGGREAQNVFVVPTYVNVDCVRNYPAATDAANSRTDTKATRLSNGVHPAPSGYRQVGDTLYAWLKAP